MNYERCVSVLQAEIAHEVEIGGRDLGESWSSKVTYLLLFHKFGVGNIVDHILPKDWRSQDRVYIFRIQILQLPVEYELIAFRPKVDRDLPSK